MSRNRIIDHIQRSIDAKQTLMRDDAFLDTLEQCASVCLKSLSQGKKILLAGNGGSAADAQHIAAEWVGRYRLERPGLPAIALTTDTSAMTAIANDYSYDYIFARQVEALASPGDVFLGISTSGNSENVLKAAAAANQRGCHTIGLSGPGGKLASAVHLCLSVPAQETATIQECHIMLGHIICDLVERAIALPSSHPETD